MKRSRHIDLQRMRKASRAAALAPAALMLASMAMTGCDGGVERATAFDSLSQCQTQLPDQADACELAYQTAQNEAQYSAPKYNSLSDCEYEFGAGQCTEEARPGGGSWFMPAMAGFLMGRALGPRPQAAPLYSSSSPQSPLYRRWSTADGQMLGPREQSNFRVGRETFQPKPMVTRTLSRGGFGAVAAAKSQSSSSLGG